MEKDSLGNGLLGEKKQQTVELDEFYIKGHLLKWRDVVIQISNISFVTSANMKDPSYPIWTVIVAFASILLLISENPTLVLIGLLSLGVAGYFFYVWYRECQFRKDHKYLQVHLNSGYTYFILFSNLPFLQDVLNVFSNIFENDTKAENNLYIDMNNCVVKDHGSIIDFSKVET